MVISVTLLGPNVKFPLLIGKFEASLFIPLLNSLPSILLAPDDPESGLPRFSVFLIGSRVEGALQPVVAGFLFDPATGNRRRWAVTPQTLIRASFMVRDRSSVGGCPLEPNVYNTI